VLGGAVAAFPQPSVEPCLFARVVTFQGR